MHCAVLFHVLCVRMCDWGRLRWAKERSASPLQSQRLYNDSTNTDVLLLFLDILGEYAKPCLGPCTCCHSCKLASTGECMCGNTCICSRNAVKRTSDAKQFNWATQQEQDLKKKEKS